MWFYDFSVTHPLEIPAFRWPLKAYVESFGFDLPPTWFAAGGGKAPPDEQYESCFLGVARPLDPTWRGAFHAIAKMRELRGRTGFVLLHISARGVVDTTRPMSYKKYVRHLRHALTKLGVDPAIARTFRSGHGSGPSGGTPRDDRERSRRKEPRLALDVQPGRHRRPATSFVGPGLLT